MLPLFKRAKSNTPDDDALMRRIGDGDRAAFEAVVRRESGPALAVARSVVQDTARAEDIVQDAWLKLWRMAPTWKAGRGKIRTWLHRIVLNAAIDETRRRKVRAEEDIDTLAETLPDVLQDSATLEQQNAALDSAIAALPDRQQHMIRLTYAGGLKNKEVAEALGVSTKAVEMGLSRARSTLRKMLTSKTPHEPYADTPLQGQNETPMKEPAS